MDKAMKVSAIAALSIVAGSVLAEPVLVSDSISDFSGAQGVGGWYYGWYNNDAVSSSGAGLTANLEAFNQFTYYSGDYGWWAFDPSSVGGEPSGEAPGSLAVATASLLHPNAPAGDANVVPEAQWGARRWVSDYAGDLTLNGHIAHYMYANAALGNGTEAYVLLDGVEVFSYIVEADDFDVFHDRKDHRQDAADWRKDIDKLVKAKLWAPKRLVGETVDLAVQVNRGKWNWAVVIGAGLVETSDPKAKKEYKSFSETWDEKDGKWRLVHLHYSVGPGDDEK